MFNLILIRFAGHTQRLSDNQTVTIGDKRAPRGGQMTGSWGINETLVGDKRGVRGGQTA